MYFKGCIWKQVTRYFQKLLLWKSSLYCLVKFCTHASKNQLLFFIGVLLKTRRFSKTVFAFYLFNYHINSIIYIILSIKIYSYHFTIKNTTLANTTLCLKYFLKFIYRTLTQQLFFRKQLLQLYKSNNLWTANLKVTTVSIYKQVSFNVSFNSLEFPRNIVLALALIAYLAQA